MSEQTTTTTTPTLPAVPGETALEPVKHTTYLSQPIAMLVAKPVPPEQVPADVDDWTQMSIEERTELLEACAEELARNTSGITVSLPKITYPSSTQKAWQLPSDGDRLDYRAVLEAVVLTKAEGRAYYPATEDNAVKAGELPTCMSGDCINPDPESKVIQNPESKGGCAKCRHSQWGSGRAGEGQACKTRVLVYLALTKEPPKGLSKKEIEAIAMEDLIDDIPTQLNLPPTSLRPFSSYVVALVNSGKALSQFVTKFGLVPATNRGGTDYQGLSVSVGPKLTYKAYKKIKAMASTYETAMRFRRGKDLAQDLAMHEKSDQELAQGIPDPEMAASQTSIL